MRKKLYITRMFKRGTRDRETRGRISSMTKVPYGTRHPVHIYLGRYFCASRGEINMYMLKERTKQRTRL